MSPLRGRPLIKAEVDLYGAVTYEVGGPPPQAVVGLSGQVDQASLARLISTTAVTLVRNARNARHFADPFVQLLRLVSGDLLERDADEMANVRIREQIGMQAEQVVDPDPEMRAAAMLGIGMPVVVDAVPGSAERTFVATLNDGEPPFGKVRGFVRGAPYLTGWGYFALVERVARSEPYRDAVVPGMAAVLAVVDAYQAIGGPPGFRQTSALYRMVGAITAAADPVSASVDQLEAFGFE